MESKPNKKGLDFSQDKREILEAKLEKELSKFQVVSTAEKTPVDALFDKLAGDSQPTAEAISLVKQIRAVQIRNEKHIEYLNKILGSHQ